MGGRPDFVREVPMQEALHNLVVQVLRWIYYDQEMNTAIDEAIGALMDAQPPLELSAEEKARLVAQGMDVVREILAKQRQVAR